MSPLIKQAIRETCKPYDILVENAIYYFCYSNISRCKIKGYEPDDLAQELLIKAIYAITKYDQKRPFMPFINTALKNKLRDINRKVVRSKDVYAKKIKYSFEEFDLDED